MNILYIASTCSKKKYYEYVESKGVQASPQAQKYNLLLVEGLASSNAQVRVLSSRPINKSVNKKLWFKGETEKVDGVEFRYVPFINSPLLRQLFLLFGTFWQILFCSYKKSETAVVCDALNISASVAVCIAATLRGFKTVGIVTDIPGALSCSENKSIINKINLSIMRKFGSYLLLTEQMSEIVNPKNHPYIVLEGHADLAMQHVDNTLEGKADKKICLYAGSLMKIYGIGNLVRGFVKANIPNTELHIYGSGDFQKELIELAKEHDNVKYLGVAPNSEIVAAEVRATLLANPRPVGEDYTKYSFPSKNMEYMASGTPVLTTKLPGMPQDHLPHVYLIEDESADGIAKVLEELLTKSEEELFEKGRAAKEFILQEKNNVNQAKKLLDMIYNL